MSSSIVLLVGNDQIIQATLLDEITGEPINNGTVTARIRTRDGADVAGQASPIAMDYVADTDGLYRGVIEDGVELVAGRSYQVDVDGVAPGDLVANWHEIVLAQYRDFRS